MCRNMENFKNWKTKNKNRIKQYQHEYHANHKTTTGKMRGRPSNFEKMLETLRNRKVN